MRLAAKITRLRAAGYALAMGIFVLVSSCSSEQRPPVVLRSADAPQLWQHSGSAQGTTFSIKYFAAEAVDPALFEQVLELVDREVNLWREDSRIVAINAWPHTDRLYSFVDSSMIIGVMWARSLELSEATGGAFDPTVGPLVELWGRKLDRATLVTPEQVDSVLQIVGMRPDRFDLDEVMENRLYARTDIRKGHPDAAIDFNAIAQGYTVDMLAEALRMEGVTDMMVELGGELFCRGDGSQGSGYGWKISVDRPVLGSDAQDRTTQTVVAVRDRAICTSGSYRNYTEVDGQRYSHMINPKTGYPTHGALLSATVMASDAATADAMATAFMVMGLEQTQYFLADHPEWGLDVLLLSDDGSGGYSSWETPGWTAAWRAAN